MIYFKLFFTAVFWGGTFIAGKLLTTRVDPYSAAFLRFLIASCCLVLWILKTERRLPRISWDDLIILLVLGLTGIFSYNLFFFSGLAHIQANRASLIIACNPVFISLCAVFFFKDRLTSLKASGLGLSLAGAFIVITRGHVSEIFAAGIGKGELLIFGCVVSWVIYSILGKKAMHNLSPIASVCYSSISGTVLLFFPACYKGVFIHFQEYLWVDWASLFYLGFFGTVLGFLWYYEGIKAIGPLKAGIFINFVPISAIVLSVLILNEPVNPSLIIGAVLVIAGVYLTNTAAYTSKNIRA